MSKYKGLFTFDVDNHRYLPIEQADGIIDCMNYHPELKMPKEPLIKDKKIRRAVRVWAELNAIKQVVYVEYESIDGSYYCLANMDDGRISIKFAGCISALKDCEEYTITELCGEGEE